MRAREDPDVSDDPEVLRAQIDRLKTEHEREIERLRGQLDGVAEQVRADRDADSVTDHLALQQEVDTLRHALREKDRAVERTSLQCRRLEDELEDQQVSYDGLKRDVDRKERALAAARDQTARLSKELQALDERYPDALRDTGLGAKSRVAGDQPILSAARRVALFAFDARFIGGVILGTLLVLAPVMGILRPDTFSLADTDIAPGGDGAVNRDPPHPQAALAGDLRTDQAKTVRRVEEDRPGQIRVPRLRDSLGGGVAGPLMVGIEGAGFTMGKVRALPSDDNGPAREVRLAGYLIGVTEVTFEAYDRFARATGRRLPDDSGWGRGRRPVADVSWTDAEAYADWLSRRTGRRYRLPSEAEWEYAASAGRRAPFWWGDQRGEARAACFDCGSSWDKRSTAPVGSFDPNPLGLYDTAGNAMEWVADCYHRSYTGAPKDGSPWTPGDCRYRVARGGAFNKPARSMRSTERHRFHAQTRLNMLGFRVARDE